MTSFHSRSNSFPSKSQPVMDEIQDHLCRLKASEATSTKAKSVSSDLASLADLHEGVKNLIQTPSIQQALSHDQCGTWINEILEGSLRLVDLCGFSRDVVCSMKEYIQDLESSIRRNRDNTETENNIKSYLASRKQIKKMISKYLKNLKSFNQNSTASLEDNSNLQAIMMVMKRVEATSFSVLNSVFLFLSGANGRSKTRNWSFLSKFTQMNQIYSETDQECGSEDLFDLHVGASTKCMDEVTVRRNLKKLKESEMIIHELEDRLESLFRSLVKARVSLLNILSDH